MVDPKEAIKGLGKTQKNILLWLAQKENLTTREEVTERWPPNITSQDLSQLTDLPVDLVPDIFQAIKEIPHPSESIPFYATLARLEEIGSLKPNLELPHAKYLTPEYLEEAKSTEILQRTKGISWNSREYLGRPETDSERVKLSNSRKALEDRGLILQHRTKGRTTHVELTRLGAIASVLLKNRGFVYKPSQRAVAI